MAEKRYFWLKLKEDFFDEKYIKALKRLPQGDSLIIVYLKMQLHSLKTEGVLHYEGIMPDCISELAMTINEQESVTQLAVEALIRFGVIERLDNDDFYMLAMQELIGSEGSSAKRMRDFRNREKTHLSQCDKKTSLRYGEIDKELELDKEINTPLPPKGKCGGKNDTQSQGESLKVKTAGGKRNHSTTLDDEEFNRFWSAYPRKVNKQAALKAWNKLKPDKALADKMLCSLEAQKKSPQWSKDNGQYIPHPATWLNGRRWEDEITGIANIPENRKEVVNYFGTYITDDEPSTPDPYAAYTF